MISNPLETVREVVETSPVVSDSVSYTTCYMCACRCGIKVHLKDGRIRYIEGNKNHPVNKGVLCAKGSAGIMQHYSPARLSKPLKRVGPRGSGEFKEIEWEEALSTAAEWLGDVRKTDPRKLAFFTGRDQSQSLTGWWASQFGTPNHAAHGGFCSVNMAAAGLYTIGGSFWEFGEPDWEHTEYFMMFGVAEDHDSNPIKAGLGKIKTRGAKFVSVNPVKTGYSAIADEWVGIRPGTDGLFVMALMHELLKARRVDLDYLVRYTNAPWLVIQDPGAADHGLFARDADGAPLCFDKKATALANAMLADVAPALVGEHTLADGRKAVPAFQLLYDRYTADEYAPDAVAERCGLDADRIRRLAAELAHAAFEKEVVIDQPWTDWAGRRHEKMIGRPVAMHAMRGISAHSNGFHTCRALHLLQLLLGSIDAPGGFRYKPPFPRPVPPPLKPAGKAGQVEPGKPMAGPPLGFPTSPEDLLVEADGTPRRIDKAYSWDAPVAAHGLMHMVIQNAWAGDPYPIDVLFMYMANMSWNSTMNSSGTMKMLTDKDPQTGEYKIPKIIYSDAYASEMVAYADLILPDTTYLERWDCISLLDRPICDADGAADSIRQPVVKPDRDVRPFQDALIEIGVRLGLPGLTKEDGSAKFPGGYPDYLANHERAPGVGPLAGFRGVDGTKEGKGEPNPDQLQRYVDNQCFWRHEFAPSERYFKHANKEYLEKAVSLGLIGAANPIIHQIYSEPLQTFRLAAEGHGNVVPPEHHRERVKTYFDPLPFWYAPFEGEVLGEELDQFPMHAITQRPAAMYHSWGSMNAWLRQIHGLNKLYMSRQRAEQLGIGEDDWVHVTSHHGCIKAQVQLMEGVNPDTVWTWNAIGKRKGAWGLDPKAPEATKGFLLNHLISELLPPKGGGYRYANADPVTGQAAWYDLRVRIERAEADAPGTEAEPRFAPLPKPPGGKTGPRTLRYGAKIDGEAAE
ncbi:molybdopterin oxidoreductase family protein [Thalassobaculum sp. OXR-137]|uniref:molybdopterin oxidoreductase family protein n=1 Tax=Thalassobaculum sp. OXR-137 TaxID=3100173 RepID=UPI002AC8BEC3|nr:molybdopterin oxidoreductase family protein [Thalassobaculum sp. OXR-137]WPZ36944.1 molybdopterin oxidoreductase family protein [Thalassobaculum sp. OXR-137]